MATAGDLVFTGDIEGRFIALDANTGETLWSFRTGSGHRGSSLTYSVNGKQFVATPSGWGSAGVGAAAQVVVGALALAPVATEQPAEKPSAAAHPLTPLGPSPAATAR